MYVCVCDGSRSSVEIKSWFARGLNVPGSGGGGVMAKHVFSLCHH